MENTDIMKVKDLRPYFPWVKTIQAIYYMLPVLEEQGCPIIRLSPKRIVINRHAFEVWYKEKFKAG